jgi:hypothetical protein
VIEIVDRDIDVLTLIAQCRVMIAPQIRPLLFPNDPSGRITRRRLAKLAEFDYLRRGRLAVVPTDAVTSCPYYTLGAQGKIILAERTGNEGYLHYPLGVQRTNHLWHYLSFTQTQLLFRQAVADQTYVRLIRWLGEDDPIDLAQAPHEQRFLKTSFPGNLVCMPDGALILGLPDGRTAIYLIEEDRATTSPRRVAAQKSPGAAEYIKRAIHQRQFSELQPSSPCRFVFISPSPGRRDSLRRAFLSLKKDAPYWRFVSKTDLVGAFLHRPILYTADDRAPVPVVLASPVTTSEATQVQPSKGVAS